MLKKYLYLFLFLLTTWYFYTGIPLDTFHSHYIILTMLGAVVASSLLAMAAFSFFPAKEGLEGEAKKKDENFGCSIIAGIVAFFFIYSILLIYNDTSRVRKEINEYGEYTTGYIVDGSSYKTRKVDMTDVTIQFTSADGQKHTVTHEISAVEFARYHQYQEIPLVYSKRYPSILEILDSDAAIAKYSKQTIRNLELRDLLNLLSLKSSKEVINYLSTVNQKWEVSSGAESGSYVFSNKFKNIVLQISLDKGLIYVHSDNDPSLFRISLVEMGFKPEAADATNGMKGNNYLNDSFLVNKRIERIKTSEDQGLLEYDAHTVVEIVKLK